MCTKINRIERMGIRDPTLRCLKEGLEPLERTGWRTFIRTLSQDVCSPKPGQNVNSESDSDPEHYTHNTGKSSHILMWNL